MACVGGVRSTSIYYEWCCHLRRRGNEGHTGIRADTRALYFESISKSPLGELLPSGDRTAGRAWHWEKGGISILLVESAPAPYLQREFVQVIEVRAGTR